MSVFDLMPGEFGENETEESRFLRELMYTDSRAYFPSRRPHDLKGIDNDSSSFSIEGIDLGVVKHYKYDEINKLTEEFSGVIVNYETGRLFKALEREVLIKTWDLNLSRKEYHITYPSKLATELVLFTNGEVIPNHKRLLHPMEKVLKSNKNLPKVIGFSCDKVLAIVYDLPLNKSVYDAITTDDFDWKDRMRLATEIANLVELFHEHDYAIGSIESRNIMIDKGDNFKMLVLGLHVTGRKLQGIYPPFTFCFESFGLDAPEEQTIDTDLIKLDVYAFGVFLLELITKKLHGTPAFVKLMSEQVFVCDEDSIVDSSLNAEAEAAKEITKITRWCLSLKVDDRPKISDIINALAKINGDPSLHPPLKKQKLEDEDNPRKNGDLKTM